MAHVVANSAGRSVLSASRKSQHAFPKPSMRVAAAPAFRVVRGHPDARLNDAAVRRAIILHAKVEKITGEQLEVEIANRDTTLIVDFFATWCGPCLLLARELEEVAEKMAGRVKVVKIDVDENPDLSNMLKIQGLPTIVIIPKENGRPALRSEGLLPAAQIMEIVAQIESGTVGQPQQQ